jgi:hypothetical protein
MAAACVLAAAGCAAAPAVHQPPRHRAALAGTRPGLPARFYGVTVDDVTRLHQIVSSLAHLPSKPAVRIVLDPGLGPAAYRDAVRAIGKVAYVMAEPVDSSEVIGHTTREYVDRFRRYLDAFGTEIPLWEVGNEVNGDWLGPANKVTADIAGAYDLVRKAGHKTALTLSYEPGCAGDPSHDMWTWAARDVPQDMKDGLDYVLVSYYEEDCGNHRPSHTEWEQVFGRLHIMFPHARLGFGEVGTYPSDRVSYKIDYLNRYYRLRIDRPQYVGGYFWWYYAEDMIPYQHNPLWHALAADVRP